MVLTPNTAESVAIVAAGIKVTKLNSRPSNVAATRSLIPIT